MLKCVSAIIALLLLCGPVSAGTEKYVDVMFGSNANDGGSWATAWATPSYGTDTTSWTTGTLASPDTMYIRGNTSDSTYLDSVQVWNLHINLVGVSDTTFSDSPVFTPFPGQESVWFRDNAGTNYEFLIDGVKFDSCGYGNRQPMTLQFEDNDSAIVRNCLFIADPAFVQSTDVGNVYISTNGLVEENILLHFINDVFIGSQYPINVHVPSNLGAGLRIDFINCDIRDCSTILEIVENATAPSDTVYYFTDCVLNADTFCFYRNTGAGVVNQTAVLDYCDTFGMDTWGSSVIYNIVRTGDTADANPDFADPDGSANAYWCYLNSTSPLITTGSGGGIIGVTWSFQAAGGGAAAVVTRRNNFFFSRWARILGIGL